MMNDNEFFTITMKTRNDKTLYLKSNGNTCEWTFNYNEAIWFENEHDAVDFAKKYFKYFNNWDINIVYTNLL